MSKCLSTKWLEFGDWNPDMFKDRDVDLEVICVEVSANIEIMVWEQPLTPETPQIKWVYYVDTGENPSLCFVIPRERTAGRVCSTISSFPTTHNEYNKFSMYNAGQGGLFFAFAFSVACTQKVAPQILDDYMKMEASF